MTPVMDNVANVRFVIRTFLPRLWCFFPNYLHKIHTKTILFKKSKKPSMAEQRALKVREWHPENIINASNLPKGYACVVINRKVTVPAKIVENLWQNAEIRCTVDGGTNRWRTFLSTYNYGDKLKLPDFITGDFDSITKETSDYFKSPDIQRVHTPDQNFTDFTKAIQVLEPFCSLKKVQDVFVFHDTSGRMDHIMANIQTLFQATPKLHVYLLAGNSLSWLLRPGTHTINIPKDLVEGQRWCALIPVGGPTNVTSTGLKWDLNSDLLHFGTGIVSTSNSYKSSQVNIQTNNGLLWSMGVFNFVDD